MVEIRLKNDNDKPLWSLLPMKPVEEVVKVFTYGAKKYAPNNWKHEKDPWNKDMSAALRHIAEYQDGNKYDDETRLNHLAHAVADLLIVLHADLKKEKK